MQAIPAPAETAAARDSLRCITATIAKKESAEVHKVTENGFWFVDAGLPNSLPRLELRLMQKTERQMHMSNLTESRTALLFKPLVLKNLVLPNRIVMAPMTRTKSPRSVSTSLRQVAREFSVYYLLSPVLVFGGLIQTAVGWGGCFGRAWVKRSGLRA